VRCARLVYADVEVRLPRALRQRCRELVRPLAVRLPVVRGVGEDHLRLERQDLAILERVGRERERADSSRATARADREVGLAADDFRPHDPARSRSSRAPDRPPPTRLGRARRRRNEQRRSTSQHRGRHPGDELDMPARPVAGGSGTTWHERLTTHDSPITSVCAGARAVRTPPTGRRAPSPPPPARLSAPATTARGCWSTPGMGQRTPDTRSGCSAHGGAYRASRTYAAHSAPHAAAACGHSSGWARPWSRAGVPHPPNGRTDAMA
jgi:hypothetical protein